MQFRTLWVAAMSVALAACGGGGTDDAASAPTLPGSNNDIVVTGTGPETPVVGGGRVAYVLSVTNAGPDVATDVAISIEVGANQSLGAIRCAAAGGAMCPANLTPTMNLPTLRKGGSLAFTVSANIAESATGPIGTKMTATAAHDPSTVNNAAAVTAMAVAPNSIKLQSESGDYIGQGQAHTYLRANALLDVKANRANLAVRVEGDQGWSGEFALPAVLTRLQVGTYNHLTRFPFHDAAAGGLDWSGEGRGCNTSTGSISITNVTYVGDELKAIDLSFEQHCEGGPAALRGQIHWTAYDGSAALGPNIPLPAGLWSPAAGVTPASGNYVYLLSDPGDYIGGGSAFLYTPANSTVTIDGNAGLLTVGVDGWVGAFAAMNASPGMRPGYYGGLQRYPFHNPAKGGLSWSGNGRGCNTLTGWFAVDNAIYEGVTLKSIDLRFEQHCAGGTPALRGKVHWAF